MLVLDPANAAALNGLARVRPPTSPTAGQLWVSPVERREMRWVPPRDFQMGSPESEPDRDEDKTQHPVTFSRGFWIDAGEVTYREYQRFVLANSAWSKENIARNAHDGNYLTDWSGTEFPAGKADQPVVNVSWHAARAYASWAGKRLPTESEWEYAGRSGATTAYWWGDTFTPRRSGVEPGPSADRRNAWGLSDMLGGVWEWTASVYQDYPYRAEDGRERAADTGQRVVRGGASVNSGRMLRVANRNPAPPELSNDSVGFRCAR